MSPQRPVRHPELGATLRRAREVVRPALSGNALAQRLRSLENGWSQAKVSLLESGRQTPSEEDVRAWAAATGAELAPLLEARDRALVRRLDVREAARRPGGVEALQGDLETLESGSTAITEYQPRMIPGLAQTPAYTRDWLSQSGRPELGGHVDVEQIVERRGERQRALRGRSIVVALDVAALTDVYGTAGVQREQLEALDAAVVAEAFELVVVLRPMAILHGFELLDDAAIVETITGVHVMSDPTVVGEFRRAMDWLRRHGVDGDRALREVRRARDELE